MENPEIKLDIVKPKPKRGRPKKVIEAIEEVQPEPRAHSALGKGLRPEPPAVVEQAVADVVGKHASHKGTSGAEPAKPKRGRPRKNPAPVEPIVKKPKGRPRKFKALLNIEVPASKYLKEGFIKKELSEMDKINMNENTQSILERAHKSGFQIRDLTKESPAFIASIPRGTFIKYITTLNQFRVGGILRQVDDQLRYFSLYNPKLKSSWSVQVKNVKYLMFKSKKNVEEEEE
jgi:hypothetical protein